MHLFRQAQRVIESLRQHDCSAALAWCADNRVRLKKVKSSLEFKLRLQEFLELVAQVSTPHHGHTTGSCLIGPHHTQSQGIFSSAALDCPFLT